MRLAINIFWLVQKYTSAQLYYINILGSKDPISLIKRNNASCQQVLKGYQQGLRRRWRADSWGKVRNPQPYYVALKQMAGLWCAGQRSTKEGSSTYLLRQASRQAFLVLHSEKWDQSRSPSPGICAIRSNTWKSSSNALILVGNLSKRWP